MQYKKMKYCRIKGNDRTLYIMREYDMVKGLVFLQSAVDSHVMILVPLINLEEAEVLYNG